MQNSNKKRICIVARSLGEGGADRVASMQSIFFTDLGYEVFIVTILNFTKYPYKGTLLNLGEIKEKDDTFFGRFMRLVIFNKFLKQNDVDVIIDHRVRSKTFSEAIISLFLYGKKAMYIVHNYKTDLYFPRHKLVAKWIYKNALKIITVSDEIKEKVVDIYRFKNVERVYNPLDFDYIRSKINESLDLDYKYIFWYGRFEDEQKNLSLLVNAYNSSQLPNLEIKLVLMGQGKDEIKINQLINSLNLNNHIEILPFSENPFSYIKNAIYTVLSSRYEGFPMTILESLGCGTPVLSVNFGSSVNEVIKNGYNGLVVQNNMKSLSEGLNKFINDKDLYLNCKEHAITSVEKYKMSVIAKEWEKLINS